MVDTPHNSERISFFGMTRLDEEIKKNVVDHLYWDNRVDASDLLVEVEEGKVKISGAVPTLFSRSCAIQDASDVAGVVEIESRIEVEHPSSETPPDDEWVLANVQNAIFLNPNVKVSDIEIKVKDGIVTVFGTVDAYWKQLHVEGLVSEQRGVRGIRNELAVVPTEVYTDQDIAKAVVGALGRSAFVNAGDVNVRVKDGNVTLTGSVPSWSARHAADEAAFYTVGVKDVTNRITATGMYMG